MRTLFGDLETAVDQLFPITAAAPDETPSRDGAREIRREFLPVQATARRADWRRGNRLSRAHLAARPCSFFREASRRNGVPIAPENVRRIASCSRDANRGMGELSW